MLIVLKIYCTSIYITTSQYYLCVYTLLAEQHCSLTNSPPEKESFLTNISKSFQKKTPTHEQDPDNLEYIMQKV